MKIPIIVLSSHVVRGSVGNRAAVFALEVLGHPVWAVPTITLPFQPGQGPGTRIISETNQFASLLEDLLASPWIEEVGAVLSGYMANPSQAESVGKFVKKLKTKNPEVLFACDPVMGDYPKEPEGNESEGKLYIAEATANAIKEHLVPLADIITPNRFELSWLTGKKILDHQQALDAAKQYAEKQILVTSMAGYMRGNIGNLCISATSAIFAEHRELKNPPNGPGDLTAALFLSHIMSGHTSEKALQKTTSFVFEIVASAAKRGADELMLETDSSSISTPMSMVQMRKLQKGPVTQIRPLRFTPSQL